MTDFKQLWIDIDEKKQKDIDRMAELRSRKKPAKMTGVHSSILELEADHEWSYTNLKKWIETQEGVAKAKIYSYR
jgi:hypothetical protein